MKEIEDSYFKIVKHISNGITHNLILWIISKKSIHGYGIMKELDEFFDFTDEFCELKATSSKVYPILRYMEKNGLIIGEWQTVNNKRVKYYSITEEGEFVLSHIKSNMNHIFESSSWLDFIEDMTGKKFNGENLNG